MLTLQSLSKAGQTKLATVLENVTHYIVLPSAFNTMLAYRLQRNVFATYKR